MFHVHLRRRPCVLGGVLYRCLAGLAGLHFYSNLLFPCCFFPWFFHLVLKGDKKSIIIFELFIYSFSSSSSVVLVALPPILADFLTVAVSSCVTFYPFTFNLFVSLNLPSPVDSIQLGF